MKNKLTQKLVIPYFGIIVEVRIGKSIDQRRIRAQYNLDNGKVSALINNNSRNTSIELSNYWCVYSENNWDYRECADSIAINHSIFHQRIVKKFKELKKIDYLGYEYYLCDQENKIIEFEPSRF